MAPPEVQEPSQGTPLPPATAAGVDALQQRTDAARAPSGTGTIGRISNEQERDAARAEELRRQFAGTSEESLQEFFGNLFNNEQLQGNPFATLVLGVIGALLGYDIGANRQAPERSTATVSDPDGTVHRENGNGEVDTSAPDPRRETNPRFGAGLQVSRETIISNTEAAAIASQTGMSADNVIKAARRSAVALNTMHPQMRVAVVEQVKAMFLAGHPVVVTECFRSNEEQNRLYAQGRNGDRSDIVTHARGGDSFHNYGLAVDIVPADINGSPVWSTGVNGTSFETIRDYMARVDGIRTIGDWDKPHYELRIPLRELQSLARNRTVDGDGYVIIPDRYITADLRNARAQAEGRAGAGSTAVAGTSPSPAAPVAEELTIAQAAWNIIPASVRSLLSGSDGNYSGSGAHKLSQSELNNASTRLIQLSVRDTSGDGIIQLAELSSYIRGLQTPAGPLLAAV